MTIATQQTILNHTKRIFACSGYDGLSMRTLAEESGVGLSSIYHFFADKDVLLKHLFDTINTELGVARAGLPKRRSAKTLLYDRILFQFQHIEEVVFVLKYFMHYREEFGHQARGYVPAKAYLHIEEVLQLGLRTGEFDIPEDQVASQAKIVTHTINGFLLEYFPNPPTGREKTEVVAGLHSFIIRALSAQRRYMAQAH